MLMNLVVVLNAARVRAIMRMTGCALLSLISYYASAGAWNQTSGEAQLISTTILDRAAKGYDGQGDLTYRPDFYKIETRFYLESGLTEKFTFVGETALQILNYRAQSGPVEASGIGASAAGLQYNIVHDNKQALSVRGRYVLGGSGENVPDADFGTGGDGVEITGDYGRSFRVWALPGFIDAEAGWTSRDLFGGPDSYRLQFTGGQYIKPNYQIMGQINFQHTEQGRHDSDIILQNSSLKLQGSLVRTRKDGKRRYEIGMFQTIDGRNIVRETGVFLGVWRSFSAKDKPS